MTTQPEDLVRRLWQQIWIEGATEELAETVADTYVRHTREGTITCSPAAYGNQIASAVSTLKGTSVDIDDIATVGDMVYSRLNLHGVNMTTGAKVKLTWIAHYRIAGDRIAESWTMHQVGLDW